MSRRSSRLSHGGSDDGTPSQDKDARGGGGALSAELKRMRTDDQFVSADIGDGGARSARTRKAPTLFQAGQEAWPTVRPSRSRNEESEDESEEDESDEEEEGEENVGFCGGVDRSAFLSATTPSPRRPVAAPPLSLACARHDRLRMPLPWVVNRAHGRVPPSSRLLLHSTSPSFVHTTQGSLLTHTILVVCGLP